MEHCVRGQGIVLEDVGEPRAGADLAPVEVVVFSDFECPGTWLMWAKLIDLLDDLEEAGREEELTVRFRHFPLFEIHSRAWAAAVASEAALAQGEDAFWAMFPHLLAGGDDLSEEHILYYAEMEGLDMDRFAGDLAGAEAQERVARDRALAENLGFRGTPGVLICGVPVDGYHDEVAANLRYILE